MKKYLSLLLAAALLCACLAGCGAKTMESADNDFMQESFDKVSDKWTGSSANGGLSGSIESPAEPSLPSVDGSMSDTAAKPVDFAEKIIYTANLSLETLRFDETAMALEQAVSAAGGYVENSNINGDTYYEKDGNVQVRNRYAWYTLRIPAEKFDAFLSTAGGLGNVTSSGKNAANVTSQYMDYEARLLTLRTEEARLLELMAKAGDIKDLIALEERLSQLRYNIESIQSNLSSLDQRIAYSSISVNLREVRTYQVTVPVQRSFLQRLGDSFRSGWDDFVEGLEDFCVGLAGAIFPLTIFAAVVGIVFFLGYRKAKKYKAAKKAQQTPPEEA